MRKLCSLILVACCLGLTAAAHNGTVGYAYPLPKIRIDGNFSDWPKDITRYSINRYMSDTRPVDDADYNGYFHVGYRVEDQSLYIAFTMTDDHFMEDSSKSVKWNSQDGLELYIDAVHLPVGSAVSSFMYTKNLRNINKSTYDAFGKIASWDLMEVAMVRKGTTRFYEWKIKLGGQLAVGKSVGLDFLFFDKDPDGSFSFASWGGGEAKYINPKSLSDIILLPANTKLSPVEGQVNWSKKSDIRLPENITIRSTGNRATWISTEVDSLGRYNVKVPEGNYEVYVPETYKVMDTILYAITQKQPLNVAAKAGHSTIVPKIEVNGMHAPDLIAAKGVLHDYDGTTTAKVDEFIETYRRYFDIPGVSLALIRDGKLVYHKTYGVKNVVTGAKVDSMTLFEAASITKPVFAFAVQRLAEKGVIDMDKPLYEYLPYEDIASDERYKLITARHVLTHRTGFPNWRDMNSDGKLNIRFTPGTSYNYSGEGFEYLKMVVEKITGKKVEQVLQEEVIEPMGLYHTFFSRNDSLRRMVAEGHNNLVPNYDELPEKPGMAWSMHTEAKVFTNFMLYLMNQKGLSEQTYKTMFSKHSEYIYDSTDRKPRYPAFMGMSLEIRQTPYGLSFGHGGNNGDFKCQFEMYKDLKMGYVVFTNSNTSDPLLSFLRDFLVEGKK